MESRVVIGQGFFNNINGITESAESLDLLFHMGDDPSKDKLKDARGPLYFFSHKADSFVMHWRYLPKVVRSHFAGSSKRLSKTMQWFLIEPRILFIDGMPFCRH